ncbi:relaxase/mobilization nuclease domain-containing protein [Rhodospirillum sp. A1_3_36]|uniref:relaxase/mobilization nuclease domain-containing protein n=1 Tax=Rhodospirillum sp. A1_3_36 TaxID=3391666 RepID=UPI0039A5A565
MIIKSLSRKTPSFGQLAAYMLAERGDGFDLRHNLPMKASTSEAVVAAFEENHTLLPRRANGNALFHEIIALSPDTSLSVKEQKRALLDLAQRYLDRRAPRQLAVGVVHSETPHVHIHLMISSNAVLGRHRLWLQKREFADIQRAVEEERLRLYPALGQARPIAEPWRGFRPSVREQAVARRKGEPSRKEELAAEIHSAMREAKSRDALNKALGALGLTLYQRGRTVGVLTEGGRRYRLATLGLSEPYAETLTRFDLVDSRMASLQRGRVRTDREWER